mmetsp:Transcript_32844/g.75099  ORF Transcript_32844/g.75099 Transcript_32844/m.75099 type:complete len:207 (-) Transcript_32844:909-1529(-)
MSCSYQHNPLREHHDRLDLAKRLDRLEDGIYTKLSTVGTIKAHAKRAANPFSLKPASGVSGSLQDDKQSASSSARLRLLSQQLTETTIQAQRRPSVSIVREGCVFLVNSLQGDECGGSSELAIRRKLALLPRVHVPTDEQAGQAHRDECRWYARRISQLSPPCKGHWVGDRCDLVSYGLRSRNQGSMAGSPQIGKGKPNLADLDPN